jgi:hypothetical protein
MFFFFQKKIYIKSKHIQHPEHYDTLSVDNIDLKRNRDATIIWHEGYQKKKILYLNIN